MILLLLAIATPAAAEEKVERRLVAMGTTLDVVVWAEDRRAALLASEAAVRAVEAVEARLSIWREDSALSALNRAPVGEWVSLPEPLAADLALAEACWRETEGAFDPSVGALLEARGVGHGGRVPSEAELQASRAASGLHHLEREGTRARRMAEIQLDSGGFGKGVGLDAGLAAATAAGARAVVLDLGGQVAVAGTSIQLEVADPDARDRSLASRRLEAGSAASSGHGERPGHLLDPRSGQVAPDFGGLTVIAPTAARADCLSTGLYVLGPERALAWAAGRPDVAVIVVERGADGPALREAGGLLSSQRIETRP